MNQLELVRVIVTETDLTHEQADNALKIVMATIQETVANGGTVQFKGFGKFQRTLKNPRPARNLKTGEIMQLPARFKATFSAGERFEAAVQRFSERKDV